MAQLHAVNKEWPEATQQNNVQAQSTCYNYFM